MKNNLINNRSNSYGRILGVGIVAFFMVMTASLAVTLFSTSSEAVVGGNNCLLDYGDAPDPTYPTYSGNDGARHTIVGASAFYLGAGVDCETNGQPNATATGDDDNGEFDDEDGVTFLNYPLEKGVTANIIVNASGPGKLDAWVDFNGDGDWADAGEQIFTSESLAAGDNALSFNVPSSAPVGTTFTRFRFSSEGGLSFNGSAEDGEVEDYMVLIECETIPPNYWQNFAPSGWWTTDQTPDCSIQVRDNETGLNVSTAEYRYSTDGGSTWSGWAPASCTGDDGTTSYETISVNDVPFNQDSKDQNWIEFRIYDMCQNPGTNISIVKIDTMGPLQTVEFGDPKELYYYSPESQWYTKIGGNTLIYINSTDAGIGSHNLTYYIQWGENFGIWPYVSVGLTTVEDNQVVPGDPFKTDADPTEGKISIQIYEDETCWHEVHYWCYDKLGHRSPMSGGNFTDFIVDCTPPESTWDFMGPHPDNVWMGACTYKVINATDKGCTVGGSGVAKIDWFIHRIIGEGNYELYKEGTVYDDGEGDYNPVDGEMSIRINVDEDCKHYISYRVFDDMGNYDVALGIGTPNKQQHWIDVTPPETDLSYDGPSCTYDEDEICVTTDTIVTINTNNTGKAPCIHPETMTFWRVYVVDEGRWYPDEATGQGAYSTYGESDPKSVWKEVYWFNYTKTFSFTEECVHYLEFFAKDPLCNTEETHNVTHYVGGSDPMINKSVGDPNCTGVSGADYCVTTETPIDIDAYVPGCCQILTVEISDDGEEWDPITVPYTHYFEKECYHELYIRAYDCLGHIVWDNETFFVDDSYPVINKTVGDPNCTGVGDADYCVTTGTPIDIDAYDPGCCPSLTVKYRVWNDTSDTGWLLIGSLPFEYHFTSECFHHLDIMAYDCLGHRVFDNETFFVDDTYPVIEKSVGDPNCTGVGGADYCVTTGTPIDIDAFDPGCCPSLTVEISDDGVEWDPITVPYTHYFREECYHELYIRAYDCLGHIVWDNETFFVDDSYPVINKTVGDPNCTGVSDADYCVTTGTPIDIDAYDPGCCPSLTVKYRVWNDTSDTGWLLIGSLPFEYHFTSECFHHLDIMAYDCLGHRVFDNETFFVDDTYPVIEKSVGDPNCTGVGGADYCVTTGTPIDIDAFDPGCCPSLTVEISDDGEEWDSITVPYTHYFREECYHELYIRAYDCLGHIVWDNETFFVDDQAPELNKKIGDPKVFLGNDTYGHHQWLIYPETEINFTAQDLGCCPSGFTIVYRVWYLGEWTIWTNYTGNITLTGGCVHYLEAKAADCLGHWSELDNETFWVCGPGGDSDPNIEIVYPEMGSTENNRTLDVKIYAYDDTTSWEDLDVYLWIPGGRRDAPYLYYDVVQLTGEKDYYVAYVPIYCYQDGAQITLEAVALDKDGNTGFAIPVTFTVDSTIVWDQWMQYGWNKLTLPYEIGCNESVERVLSSIEGSYDWVFNYDPQDGWTSYSPDLDPIYITLWELSGGEQYWVHVINESGLRYYIGAGEIEIQYPEDGVILFDLNEINGTAWNSEAGIEEVDVQIYYKNETSVKYYWNGAAWTTGMMYLPCSLDNGYIQPWLYDSGAVAWIPGETFYIKARATDGFGCYAYDMVSFTFEECICAPGIDLEKYVWNETLGEWVNETNIFVDETALFNITIQNDGQLIGSDGNGGSEFNETILQAIDDGLAWLAAQQNSVTGAVPTYGNYHVAGTAFAVLKWAEHARKFENKDPFDPTWIYANNTIKGLNYIFNHSHNITIGTQPAGDPDSNGNGKGTYFYTSSQSVCMYETPAVMMALEACNHPERIVEYGDHAGLTYSEVMTDLVDYISWGQNDVSSGTYRGGWRYYHNYGSSDNSVSQWPVLGLISAEAWGINVPSWVKDELLLWLNYSQKTIAEGGNGGFGYTSYGSTDIDVTAAGMIQLTWCGKTMSDDEMQDARDYIGTYWDAGGSQQNFGHMYSLYAVMKAAMLAEPNMITHFGSHDWQAEYDTYLLDHQYPDGHWSDVYGNALGTEWALLVLQRIIPGITTECPSCDLTDWYINDTLPEGLEYVENSTKITVISCDGYYQSSGLEVQPQAITINPDGTTTLEWWETGSEPFNLTLCTIMYIEFNATVLNCEAPDGHINTAYISAYSPDDESWVSDEDDAKVWGICEQEYAISGNIYYEGQQNGSVFALLFDEMPEDGSIPIKYEIFYPPNFPIPYLFDNLSNGDYYVMAFMDTNSNMTYEIGEPFGCAVNNSWYPDTIVVSGADVTGQDVTLEDPNPSVSFMKSVWNESYWDDSTDAVYIGGDVLFNITIYNTGNVVLTSATPVDYLPNGLDYTEESTVIRVYMGGELYEEVTGSDAEPSQGSYPGGTTLTWSGSEYEGEYLPPDIWVFIEFEATIEECADEYINLANLTAQFYEYGITYEDTAIVIPICEEPETYDFGDAPDPTYPTLLANDGARHIYLAPYMGVGVDSDPDGQPTINADGDDNDEWDDEDGVEQVGQWFTGETGEIDINMTWTPFGGNLSAWVDFNQDGDWDDAGEQIFADMYLSEGTTHTLIVSIPGDALLGPTYARFRMSTDSGLSYTAEASDGEVEDHVVTIYDNKTHMWIIPSSDTVNDGDNFNATIYIDPNMAVGGFKMNVSFTQGLANATEVTPGTYYDSFFWDPGDIDNSTGLISGIEAFASAGFPDTNHAACTINFTALKSGILTIEIIDPIVTDSGFTIELEVITHSATITIL